MNLDKYRKCLYEISVWAYRDNYKKVEGIFNLLSSEEKDYAKLGEIHKAIGNNERDALEVIKSLFSNYRRGISITQRRQVYARAYEAWMESEDIELRDKFRQGDTIEHLSSLLKRSPGAVHQRLIKLGLVEKDADCECECPYCEKEIKFQKLFFDSLFIDGICEECKNDGLVRMSCTYCEREFEYKELNFDPPYTEGICENCRSKEISGYYYEFNRDGGAYDSPIVEDYSEGERGGEE